MAKITMEHGSGGSATDKLISEIFSKEFYNDNPGVLEDAAVAPGAGTLAITTDSFVVDPVEYPGGNIGKLCVCGTVNDLLMRGAVPKYLTCGFILQEGLEIELLEKVVHSLAETAKEANVTILAGDTKVVEGKGGLFINTAGVGFVPDGRSVSAANPKPGDVIIVSGTVGEHHAAILSQRLSIANNIASDNAVLVDMVGSLFEAGVEVHTLRDVTRGGLATILKELAVSSQTRFELKEENIPVTPEVKNFCGLLGLDPLYMGNEGKMVAIVPESDLGKALDAIRKSKYGENATVIGKVVAPDEGKEGSLVVKTRIGGTRVLEVLQGEGLPRIC